MTKLKLKPKQFAKEYIKEKGNGTKAYQKVYDASYNTAKANASRLLTKDNIKQEIADLIDKQEDGTDEAIVSRIIERAKDTSDKTNATRNDEILLKLKGKFKKDEGTTLNSFLSKLQ